MTPKHHIIKILGHDTSNGDLGLNDTHLDVNSGDTIQWIKLGHSGVDSIEGITEKNGIDDVWITRPLGKNNWKGTIKEVSDPYIYQYNIHWKKKGIEYTFDPKITIYPSL